jgi:hypothetical protein
MRLPSAAGFMQRLGLSTVYCVHLFLSTHNWLVVQLNPASAHIAGASDLKLGPCGRRCAVSLFPFSKVARGRRLVLGKSGLRIKAFSDRDMG